VTDKWNVSGMALSWVARSFRRKPVLVELRSPQISHKLEWDRNRASAVKVVN